MNTPAVSVIIPTRNRLDKLRRALRSVDQQIFRDFEVWVVDDGSTDGTGHFLKSGQLTGEYPNIPSIRILINEKPCGAAAARNQAMALSTGELLAFLDDDDVWLPAYLQEQSQCLAEHPDAACCARHLEFEAGGRTRLPDAQPLLEYDRPLVRLLSESFVHSMSVFVCRREVFTSIGPLNEDLHIVHDWDWYARLLVSGRSIRAPEGAVLVRREVPGGLVAHYRKWHSEEIDVLSRYLGSRDQRMAGAHRALLFARIGLDHGDCAFAARRLMDACLKAPLHSAKILALRVCRNLRPPTGSEPSKTKEVA